MNRIYQGRVNKVQILKEGVKGKSIDDWEELSNDPNEARRLGEELLWNHHQLFQDAVNYYIVALAALGSSSESKLTKLRELLGRVWEAADKNGQTRKGMRESLQRAWQMEGPPTLEGAIQKLRDPLTKNGVQAAEMELAGESLAFDLGGEGSIQQGGIEYWPYFCQSGFKRGVTFPREAAQLTKEKAVKQVARLVWHSKAEKHVLRLNRALKQMHFCNVSGGGNVLQASRAKEVFTEALETLQQEGHISKEQAAKWTPRFDERTPEILEYAGGSVKYVLKTRFYGFLVFKHLSPDVEGLKVLESIYEKPEEKKASKKREPTEKDLIEARLIALGEDPIKKVRERARIVFRAFTALPAWKCGQPSADLYERSAFEHELEAGESHQVAWKLFDVAAFKEALKVYNQFQQNVEKREDKLNGFATKLLVMDGEQAMAGYTAGADKHLRDRLEKVWNESKGKPKLSSSDSGDEIVRVCFTGDPRIDRLRRIINDDLAEEYRLTDGRRTAYGLRRRTMKGWGEVKRKWQGIVKKGEAFSAAKRDQLKAVIDEMRGGEKREQIGSHKLFEAMIADEAAWGIWREPQKELEQAILKNEWAPDPLEAFREYCEIREAMEDVAGRPLNFTPADAQFSRRLFMFTDACSFGNDGGEYRHDLGEQAVMVPVAVCGTDGRFTVQTCRLAYSAPRMLRDQIRAEDGSYAQDWTQPMMQALFGKVEGKANPQELKDAAVQLMPDYDNEGQRRVLLNFPLNLATTKCWEASYAARGEEQKKLFGVRFNKKDKKKEKPINAGLWESNIRTFWENDAPKKRDFLCWPIDERKKLEWSKGDWWEKLTSFRVLAADLGTRHAASIALVECSQQGAGTARFIGKAGEKDWYGRFRSGSILRLPGEDAMVLRPRSAKDKDDLGKAFREELYGKRGRPADDAECEETLAILTALCPAEKSKKPDEKTLPHQGLLRGITDTKELQKQFTLPELNDKLLVAMRRAQGWIATCISWHWKLTQPDNEGQRQGALTALREQERVTEWRPLADGEAGDLIKLRDALHVHISNQRQCVQEHLLQLTRRTLPLRGRQWEWVSHPEKPDCHLLRQTADGTGSEKVKLRGQRGLSMARIEQLSELRRRWQSLNQSMRRQIGEKPLTASEMRNDPIPDPCPDVLIKLENIREQRVNQTAHLILAQALGLMLREPQKSAQSRAVTDTHGEYVVARPPVDFIVLEDLSRYLSDQGRAKSENTRLMKWCHRAIMMKVKMLAEPFGIPVLETPAAYSSRFCSLTGMAGFRAAEIGWEDRHEFRWRVLRETNLEELRDEISKAATNRQKLETLERQHAAAKAVQDVFHELEKISLSTHPNRTLVAPQPGGPMFITAKEARHPAPSANRRLADHSSVLPMQADLNAAANLALRAVAHPGCAGIHHRLRTERKKGAKTQPDIFMAREKRRFGSEKEAIILREGDLMPKERNTNLFYDEHCVAEFGRARFEAEPEGCYPYASGPGLWKSVNERFRQWGRCFAINAARLRSWGIEPPPEWEPRKRQQPAIDPDDNIPGV